MSVNGLISIKNPIIDAMDQLAIDHDKLIPLFTRWATLAEKEIGSRGAYVTKRKVLNIEHCVACLPSEAVYIEIALLGDQGCDCGDLMSNICGCINTSAFGGSDGTFLIVDIGTNGGTSIMGYVPHTIQNNKLIFQQDMDGQQVTIQYLAQETDEEGFVLIGQNHVLAITEYIIWKYYRRKTNMNSLEYGKMNMAKEEWTRECGHARAVDSQLTESDRQSIVGMLHNPYIGISLSTGMHTTLDNTWGSNTY